MVWFGESLEPSVLGACHGALRHCEVLLIVGTSGLVYPAAGMAAFAQQHGAFVANFNLDATHAGHGVDAAISGPCEETLVALVQAVHHRHGGGPG